MDRETLNALDFGIKLISEKMRRDSGGQRVLALAPVLRDLAVARAVLGIIRNREQYQ